MAPNEPKTSKQASGVKTWNITLIILDTFEIIRETGSAI
jgi:hypothetical protein